MTKRILITGGAGFIGFHLASWLASQGHDITILDNFTRGEEDEDFNTLIALENVKLLIRDITITSTFNDLKDFDDIYHLAAINGTQNFYSAPDKVLRVGIIGTLNILDWFKDQPHGKLLFTSSSETYAGAHELLGDNFPIPTPEEVPLVISDPKNARWSYGGSKILGEVMMYAYMKAYNLFNRISLIRYHNIYGPRMGFEHVVPQFIERIIKRENPFKIYGADASRTFCYIDDAVKATQLTIETISSMGRMTNIGRTDGEIKILDLAKMLFDITGYDVPVAIESAPEGSVMRRCPDISRLRSIGYKPNIDLGQGLRKCFEWYKNKF